VGPLKRKINDVNFVGYEFAIYEPVLKKFIVNTCLCPPPLFTLCELPTAVKDKFSVGNQQAIYFLEFGS